MIPGSCSLMQKQYKNYLTENALKAKIIVMERNSATRCEKRHILRTKNNKIENPCETDRKSRDKREIVE
jgi:hypothetical protein